MNSNKSKKDNVLPKVETIISSDTIIKGNIKLSSGTIRIDGQIDAGNINSIGIVIGEQGKIKGNLFAENIVISGEIHGNIKATNSLEMLKEAKVFGDISTPNFIMAKGSIFEGNCDMKKNKVSNEDLNESENEETEIKNKTTEKAH